MPNAVIFRLISLGFILLSSAAFAADIPKSPAQYCREQANLECKSESTRDFPNCRQSSVSQCMNATLSRVTTYPKYYLETIIYAPPGCSSKQTKCSQPSKVDYQSSKSTSTKSTIAKSFKDSSKLAASLKFTDPDSGISLGGGGSLSVSQTTSDSMTISKSWGQSEGHTFAGGPDDGVDHLEDFFVLFLNPVISIEKHRDGTVIWSMGVKSKAPEIDYPIKARWLSDPTQMPDAVSKQLSSLGVTPSDYGGILSLDPLLAKQVLDPNRFSLLAFTMPYIPPDKEDCASGTCQCRNQNTHQLTDSMAIEKVHSVQTEYTVGANFSIGSADQKNGLGLTSDNTITFTSTNSESQSESSSHSASVQITCPSQGYNGPTILTFYWDNIYQTFVTVPYSDNQGVVPLHSGNVVSAAGKPVVGQEVSVKIGSTTYRTLTDARGAFSVYGKKTASKNRPQTGTVSVGQRSFGAVPLKSSHGDTITVSK